MPVNIWGAGGAFQQLLDSKLASAEVSRNVAQQQANADTTRANALATGVANDAARNATDFMANSAPGLRGLGKGRTPTTLFDDSSALSNRSITVGNQALRSSGVSSGPGAPVSALGSSSATSLRGTPFGTKGDPGLTDIKLRGFNHGGMVGRAARAVDPTVRVAAAENAALGIAPKAAPKPKPAPEITTTVQQDSAARIRAIRERYLKEKQGYQNGGLARPAVPADAPPVVLVAEPPKKWNAPRPEPGTTTHRLLPVLPRVVEQNSGTRSPRPKVSQPGYARGGKIKMPEPSGPIGDVAQDTGQDTEQVVVRPGEYLLNPETVAFFGQGNYEQGVRQLNQIVRQATGEEPGPEPVGKPGGGEQLGFALSGQYPPFYVDPMGTARASLETGLVPYRPQPEVQAEPTPREPRGAFVRTPSREQAAWEAEKVRQNTPVEPAKPSAAAAQWAKSNPNVDLEGVRNVAKQVAKSSKYALKPVAWAVKGTAKSMPYVAPGLEAGAIADVATDPTMNNMDIAEQGFESAGKLAAMGIGAKLGATGGAAVGAFFPPAIPFTTAAGALIGGGLGYYGADQALDAARGALPGHNGDGRSPSDRSYGSVKRALGFEDPNAPSASNIPSEPSIDPKAYADALYDELRPSLVPPETGVRSFISPQNGVRSTGSPVFPERQSEDQMVANYLAHNSQNADVFGANPVNAGNLRQIPGTDTKYAGSYGGQDVIVTRGAHGEPVFTGLRSPEEVEASRLRSVQEQAPPPYEEELRNKIAAIESGEMPANIRTYEVLQNSLARIEEQKYQTAAAPANGRKIMTPGELSADTQKVLEPMFAQYGEGAPTAMSQFIRDISGTELGPVFNQLPPDEQAKLVDHWATQNEINAAAQRELKQAGSDFVLAPGLRGTPKFSNIRPAGWTDVLNPDSSFGLRSYAADVFGGDTPLMADMTAYGLPTKAPYRVNYSDIIDDNQLRQELLSRQGQ